MKFRKVRVLQYLIVPTSCVPLESLVLYEPLLFCKQNEDRALIAKLPFSCSMHSVFSYSFIRSGKPLAEAFSVPGPEPVQGTEDKNAAS